MTLQTIISNLTNTIEGKEKLLASIQKTLLYCERDEELALKVTADFLKINLTELNHILDACREAYQTEHCGA